jgi:hypothetical protein
LLWGPRDFIFGNYGWVGAGAYPGDKAATSIYCQDKDAWMHTFTPSHIIMDAGEKVKRSLYLSEHYAMKAYVEWMNKSTHS